MSTKTGEDHHVFMALYAAFRVECLRIKHHLKNHALKTKLYVKAIRAAFEQLQKLKAA